MDSRAAGGRSAIRSRLPGLSKMNIAEVNDLYLLMRDRAVSWVAPDLNGAVIALDPQPAMLRTAYALSPLEQSIVAAKGQLSNERGWLLALAPCPDGPPYRSGLLFTFTREVNWGDGKTTAYLYGRATRVFSLGSDDGFFLTGPDGDSSIWRLFRAELDAFNRWVLTLSPIRLASQCPSADFSSLKTPLLAHSVAAQYADLARALTAKTYMAVVTHAKNIVEGIISEKLGSAGKGRDLAEDLRAIRKLLEGNPKDGSSGWTYLEYHLAQKIRLVHGQTHATAPVRTGRPLRPESFPKRYCPGKIIHAHSLPLLEIPPKPCYKKLHPKYPNNIFVPRQTGPERKCVYPPVVGERAKGGRP